MPLGKFNQVNRLYVRIASYRSRKSTQTLFKPLACKNKKQVAIASYNSAVETASIKMCMPYFKCMVSLILPYDHE